MRKLHLAIVGLGLIAIVLALLGPRVSSLLKNWAEGKSEICSIPIGSGEDRMNIFTDNLQEIHQALYYEIRTRGKLRAPLTFFDGVPMDEKITDESFVMIKSKDGDLVGIAMEWNLRKILIIHEISSGKTWPSSGYSDEASVARERGEAWIKRLRRESGIANLVLNE